MPHGHRSVLCSGLHGGQLRLGGGQLRLGGGKLHLGGGLCILHGVEFKLVNLKDRCPTRSGQGRGQTMAGSYHCPPQRARTGTHAAVQSGTALHRVQGAMLLQCCLPLHCCCVAPCALTQLQADVDELTLNLQHLIDSEVTCTYKARTHMRKPPR